MTGDQSKFVTMRLKDGSKVTFEGNQFGKIAGVGEIGENDGPQIKDVYYVGGFCHNLLNVSQSVDKNNLIIFDLEECLIVNKKDLQINKDQLNILFKVSREGNYYTINMPCSNSEKCFVSNMDESWLWHK